MINIVDLDAVTNLTYVNTLQITGGYNRSISHFPEELREELLSSNAAFNDFSPSLVTPVESVGGYTGSGSNYYGGFGRLTRR